MTKEAVDGLVNQVIKFEGIDAKVACAELHENGRRLRVSLDIDTALVSLATMHYLYDNREWPFSFQPERVDD